MAGERPTYDEPARARIREALKRYQAEHGIGVPTLQARIVEFLTGSKKELDRLPGKTIQRFLADTHRTTDPTVHLFVRFLSSVAPPSPAESLAAPLASFLARPGPDLTGFLGKWRTKLRALPQQPISQAPRLPGQVRVVPIPPPNSEISWSTLTVTGTASLGFLRAQERLALSEDVFALGERFADEEGSEDEAPTESSPEPDSSNTNTDWLGNTGLLVPWGRGALLLLRSYLETRLYVVAQVGGGPDRLEGSVLQAPSLFDVAIPGLPEPFRTEFQIIMSRP